MTQDADTMDIYWPFLFDKRHIPKDKNLGDDETSNVALFDERHDTNRIHDANFLSPTFRFFFFSYICFRLRHSNIFILRNITRQGKRNTAFGKVLINRYLSKHKKIFQKERIAVCRFVVNFRYATAYFSFEKK